jgi:hypothetical protein
VELKVVGRSLLVPSDLTAGLILLAVYVRCAPIVPSDQEKTGYAGCGQDYF